MESPNNMGDWTTIIGSGTVGAVLVAAITAWFKWRAEKPKTEADAEKIKADVTVTFADGWRNLYLENERRIKSMQEMIGNMQTMINNLEARITLQKDEYETILRKKDAEIVSLQSRVKTLEDYQNNLIVELQKYQKLDSKTEEARETLHHTVDESLDHIKTQQ